MKKFLWLLVVLCCPAWSYAQNYPLYVTDGKSLSTIDLSSQTKTKVGDFPTPLGSRVQLSYDWTHHILYAFDGSAFWTIEKDTAQTQGPLTPRYPLTDASGHAVAGPFVATYCYRNNTFYLIGFGSNGLALVSLNPFEMEVLDVADYPGPFVQQMTCATYDDSNDALLVGGFVVERGGRTSSTVRVDSSRPLGGGLG